MYKDLRGFIEQVDKLGALRRIEGADPRSSSAASPRWRPGDPNARRCCSTRSRACRAGFRVFTNAATTPQRAALALGIDPSLRPLDALKAWMEKRQTLQPHSAGRGDGRAVPGELDARAEVDLGKFPAPDLAPP